VSPPFSLPITVVAYWLALDVNVNPPNVIPLASTEVKAVPAVCVSDKLWLPVTLIAVTEASVKVTVFAAWFGTVVVRESLIAILTVSTLGAVIVPKATTVPSTVESFKFKFNMSAVLFRTPILYFGGVNKSCAGNTSLALSVYFDTAKYQPIE